MAVNLQVGMVDLVEVVVLMYLLLLEVRLDTKDRQQVQDHLLRFKDIQVVHMVLEFLVMDILVLVAEVLVVLVVL
jgi:hypothetical protein